jgi:toxin ParE1/3/4
MGFRLRAKAETDILSIMNYIGRDNPAAALKWQAEIFRIFELLGDRPGIGRHAPR